MWTLQPTPHATVARDGHRLMVFSQGECLLVNPEKGAARLSAIVPWAGTMEIVNTAICEKLWDEEMGRYESLSNHIQKS